MRKTLIAYAIGSLLVSGTASAAMSYTPGTYFGESIGRNGPVKVVARQHKVPTNRQPK